MEKITLPAQVDKLYEMLQFVQEKALKIGINEEVYSKIELALEEALVNIISHGYKTYSGEIEIICEPLEAGLKIILKDSGIPYNPLEKENDIDEDNIGGLGIRILLMLMDEVLYTREDKYNILTLIKKGLN